MATTHIRSNASVTFTPPDGTEEEHLLAIPLWDVRPVDRGRRYEFWAEDFDTREVVTVADGVSEAFVTIRMDNQPVALKRMLRLALRHDLTLTYTRDGTDTPFRLLSVEGASGLDETPLAPDRDRLGYGEWEARLHIRAPAGSTLDALYSDES